jgi:opacity protein-like surface antigen
MKRILLTTSLLAAFAAPSAFAKTEGNYVGLDILRANAKHRYQESGTTASNYPEFSDSSIGYGVNYKYAFNFDNVFVAPGVFFEKLGTEAKDKDGDSVSVNYRYGIKANVGYDVTDDFAAYITAGAASTSYEVDWKAAGLKKSGSKIGYIVGAGLSYNVAKDVSLNVEYNVQPLTVSTPDDGGINQAKTTVSVAKLGIAYRF